MFGVQMLAEGRKVMIRASVNLAVDNVRRSSAWYQRLLGCTSPMSPGSDHREVFDLLEDSQGNFLIALSRWDHNPLAPLRNKAQGPAGHGTVLFFSVSAFEESWAQAQALDAEVVAEPHPSRGFEVPEYTVRDLDGYFVTVSAAAGAKPK